MATNLLTAHKIKKVGSQEKAYWLKDGGSLFLYVTPTGSKLWRYRYRIGTTARVYSIGKYPEVDLYAARQERDKARRLVRQGIHPLIDKKSKLHLQIECNNNTFKTAALHWISSNTLWTPNYAKQVSSYMTQDVFPQIGALPITAITTSMLRVLITQIAERGANAALAVRQWISQVFHHAAQHGWCEHDPAAMLKRFIKRPPIRHNPPLPWQEIQPFMQALQTWNGFITTRTALHLLALTFVRTVELRRATWDQINLDNATWSIPAGHMKMRRPHIVPLSTQAITLLTELHAITGHGRLLFPNQRRPYDLMGTTTLNTAIHYLGYKGRFSAHGFRSTATTLLGLLGYPDNRVDLQLAHRQNDASRAPYDHTKHLSSRRIMMQDWADIWDAFANGQSIEQATQEFGPMSARQIQLLSVTEREH